MDQAQVGHIVSGTIVVGGALHAGVPVVRGLPGGVTASTYGEPGLPAPVHLHLAGVRRPT